MSIEEKANACIVYLCGPEDRDRFDLEESLKFLHIHFNKKFNYDIIIFHENFTQNYVDNLLNHSFSALPLQVAQIELPIDTNKPSPDIVIGSTRGYRAQCRWFSGPFFFEDAVKNYKWIWHFDTDSRLCAPLEFDPFLLMEKHKLKYGYQTIFKEESFACVDFWSSTSEFIKNNNVKPKNLSKFLDADGNWDKSYFYSDFAIFNADFFRSKECQSYFDFIDKKDLFFQKRIGDTLMASLMVWMFLEENELFCFKDYIAWNHQMYCSWIK